MEFGSDFHYCDYPRGRSLLEFLDDVNLYISGRQALIDLIKNNNWKHLWLPSYYCYDFVKSILPYISVKFYDCLPSSTIEDCIAGLNIGSNDAIIITNYYGITRRPKFPNSNISIIEDHSHDLISDWAVNSTADWCFASLRKTIPIADGGILWSPKKKRLPQKPPITHQAETFADERYEAMTLKRGYLLGCNIEKHIFRDKYIETENQFDILPISRISNRSYEIISNLDIENWYKSKKANWEYLVSNIIVTNQINIKTPEINQGTYPFSVIIECDSCKTRDNLKTALISANIYPAILWNIPDNSSIAEQEYSNKMLSLHCDARYSLDDIKELTKKINDVIICLQ